MTTQIQLYIFKCWTYMCEHILTGKLEFSFSADNCSNWICCKTLITSCIPISVGVNNHKISSVQLITILHTQINIASIQLPSVKQMSRIFPLVYLNFLKNLHYIIYFKHQLSYKWKATNVSFNYYTTEKSNMPKFCYQNQKVKLQ